MDGWSKGTYRLREIMEKTGNHMMYYLPVVGSEDPLDGSERAFVLEELMLIPEDTELLLITFRNGRGYRLIFI